MAYFGLKKLCKKIRLKSTNVIFVLDDKISHERPGQYFILFILIDLASVRLNFYYLFHYFQTTSVATATNSLKSQTLARHFTRTHVPAAGGRELVRFVTSSP